MIDKALEIAIKAYSDLSDKAGKPLIGHALFVAGLVKKNNGTDEEVAVALLHDVVEDTSITIEDLEAEGFTDNVLRAVDAITRQEGESYKQFITRISFNSIATKVKIFDLQHNGQLSRLSTVTKGDKERNRKYFKAWRKLNLVKHNKGFIANALNDMTYELWYEKVVLNTELDYA